ncbi:MAG: hypothetical protein Ct9H300mP15_13580 [Gemmatimonadota bacterium]|nr:MAG: hypothetical protein Ct9H300mP15_13580 [Gemmatimonadota bacterium]
MYSTESESGKKLKLGWEINLYTHRMLLIVSIALVNPIFSDWVLRAKKMLIRCR